MSALQCVLTCHNIGLPGDCAAVFAGVSQCITIAAQAPVPGLNPVQDLADFIDLLNAGLVANASGDDHHTCEQYMLSRRSIAAVDTPHITLCMGCLSQL